MNNEMSEYEALTIIYSSAMLVMMKRLGITEVVITEEERKACTVGCVLKAEVSDGDTVITQISAEQAAMEIVLQTMEPNRERPI